MINTSCPKLPSYVQPALDMHVHPPPGEGRIEALFEAARQVGIARLILSDLGQGEWRQNPHVEHVRRANERVYRIVADHPNFAYGLVYVNPNHAETRDILEEGLAQSGIVGIKLWVSCRDEHGSIDPVYPVLELAQQRGVPVLLHSYERTGGNLHGELSPADIAGLADRYPQANLIMAHLGGLWLRGVRVVQPYPNVYADVCGSRAYLGMVEHAVRELGSERVLYGSDAHGRAFSGQIAKVIAAEIEVSDKRRILWDNSVALFLGREGEPDDR
jgi:predicted TIM-barrel fold metal-dependent hydrolase